MDSTPRCVAVLGTPFKDLLLTLSNLAYRKIEMHGASRMYVR